MKKEDIQLLHDIFLAMGYPLQGEGDKSTVSIELYYVNNPDGSLRWAWPAGQSEPRVLKFYNTSSLRASMIALLIRLMFWLRLSKLFASGNIRIYLRAGHLEQFLGTYGFDWALFSGTAGVTQTAVFCTKGLFHKIPVGKFSPERICHEYKQHRYWKFFTPEHIEIAHAAMKGAVLTQSDVASGGKRSALLSDLHWSAIRELSQKGTCSISLSVLPVFRSLYDKLNDIEQAAHPDIPVGLLKKLRLLLESVDTSQIITAGYAHGDFTPWNMFVKEKKLALIDWEMAETCSPLLFDAFHFVIQQGVLVDHLHYDKLKIKLDDALSHPAAEQLIDEYAVDVPLHFLLYILFITISSCEGYIHGNQLRLQNRWSIGVWSAAVDDLIVQKGLMSPRQVMISSLFSFLNQKRYAALKWMMADPASLPEDADVDICLDPALRKEISEWINHYHLVHKVRQTRKSFMDNYAVWLCDHSFLSVDTIFSFKRKELVMMDAKQLLDNASTGVDGVKIPAVETDFTYVWLFYLLNNAPIPQKYQQHYNYRSVVQARLLNERFAWKQLLHIRNYRELFVHNSSIREKTITILRDMPENKGIAGWNNKLLYVIDSLRGVLSEKGFTITFSGVDGAGKSTVIEKVKHHIEKRYRKKVVVLRHRPALLPMLSAWKQGRRAAEARAASVLPRQGQNRNLLSSLFRFAYYYADYLAGQFAVQVKYIWRGYVVIYDRYYFDFIQDSKRSNIMLPSWLTRPWYAFLLKPSCNFFLYADADTILRRKQELDKETIQTLTGNYLSLFSNLSGRYRHSRYIAVENEEMSATLNTIFQHIKQEAL